jgi:hypothetical protein
VLLDTCESGALVAGQVQARSDAEAAVGRLHHATGRPVLPLQHWASSPRRAWSAERVNGTVFSPWAILDSLRNGDTSGNGFIELSETVAHVQTLVPKLAEEMGGVARTTGVMNVSPSDRQNGPLRLKWRRLRRGDEALRPKFSPGKLRVEPSPAGARFRRRASHQTQALRFLRNRHTPSSLLSTRVTRHASNS